MNDGKQDDSDGQATNSSQAFIRQVEQELRSDGLEPEQAEKVIRLVKRVAIERIAIEKQHRGPLPAAEDFAGYEKVFPGAAKEILGMAIRQQNHAHQCDILTINGEISYRNYGMLAAVFVVTMLVAGSVACALAGQTAVAATLGGTAGIATLAGAFIKGRRLFDLESPVKSKAERSEQPSPPTGPVADKG
jgi:uncharacterized membrane protein